MKQVIECPYYDGQAENETKENKELSFRKEAFKVAAHFYKCNKCFEEFYDNRGRYDNNFTGT